MSILETLEQYYDAAPRPLAVVEEAGPFTVFLRRSASGWPYYARPRLGNTHAFTAADVAQVRARQRERGVPEALEWVRETTPSLLEAARTAGMRVRENPLLVLPDDTRPEHDNTLPGVDVRLVAGDAPDLGVVMAAVEAGFSGTDDVVPSEPGELRRLVEDGLLVLVGAYDGQAGGPDGRPGSPGVVGGGSHNPRGAVTELTGIAVLPSARRRGIGAAITRALAADARNRGIETVFLSAQDDAVARVYERVGFVRVGVACVAQA